MFKKVLCYNKKKGENMKKEPTQTMTIRVPISMHLRLQMLASQDSRTVNGLVNKILNEYVNELKK